jgi:peptide chain release factor subunit 1
LRRRPAGIPEAVNGVAQAAKRLVDRGHGHAVISLYLDLDPERFATAPARASQIRSLIDEAARHIDRDGALEHDERVGLRADLKRIDDYLNSREPPVQGARALAVFCSSRDGLFEAVPLPRRTEARVMIESAPYIEPLIAAMTLRRWCVMLVNRRSARLLTGSTAVLRERERLDEHVHGQHDQGGWSQANYERSVEKDTDDHLRHAADMLRRRWRRERFDRLALGGPPEIVPRIEALLGDDERSHLASGRVEVNVGGASEDQVRAAVAKLAADDEKRVERDALDRLAAGIGAQGRATGGPADTVEALNERRVAVLLLEAHFDGPAARCPSCGLVYLAGDDRCPVDGTPLENVEHLREAAVEAAVAQDADVMIVNHYPDLGPFRGIAALLRF